VVGVVTQPDRPQGRSRSTLVPSPVKVVASQEGIPVLQPERPRGADFTAALRELEPDLSVVVAYGHLLIQEIIDLPTLGTLNIHASLLPRWRGAAPIQAALLAGDAETGVSIRRMVLQLDAGPVMLQSRTPILDDETSGELQLRLSELGAQALIEALALIELGGATEQAQDESLVTYASKIEREHARVDWSRDAAHVARVIRAYDPRPGAFTTLGGDTLKLFGARAADASGTPGQVLEARVDGLLIACGSGAVRVAFVQPAGKKRMPAAEWARGRTLGAGARLGG
jgi:methionyl-tRNA formyltransferase